MVFSVTLDWRVWSHCTEVFALGEVLATFVLLKRTDTIVLWTYYAVWVIEKQNVVVLYCVDNYRRHSVHKLHFSAAKFPIGLFVGGSCPSNESRAGWARAVLEGIRWRPRSLFLDLCVHLKEKSSTMGIL